MIWIVKPIVKRIFIVVTMDSNSIFTFLFSLMCENVVVIEELLWPDGRCASPVDSFWIQ